MKMNQMKPQVLQEKGQYKNIKIDELVGTTIPFTWETQTKKIWSNNIIFIMDSQVLGTGTLQSVRLIFSCKPQNHLHDPRK